MFPLVHLPCGKPMTYIIIITSFDYVPVGKPYLLNMVIYSVANSEITGGYLEKGGCLATTVDIFIHYFIL
jgi:hypothetical protein